MVLEFKKCLKTLKANRQLDNCTYQGEKKHLNPVFQCRGKTILLSQKDTTHSLPRTVRNPNC